MKTDEDVAACICAATGATAARRGERIQSLWSGWGEIVRFHLTGASVESVILKRVQPPAIRRSDRGGQRKRQSYIVERTFYADYAPRCPARIPLSRHLAPGLFVLEDLDDAGFSGRGGWRLSQPHILRCLDWLATFHAAFLHTPPDGLWPVGTYWHLDTRPDEHAVMPAGPLKSAAAALDAALSSARFQTLVHGDAKVANFCFGPDAVAALDFQYVGGGCGMKDVAYFLGSALDDAGLDAQAEGLVTHYLARLAAHLPAHIDADALEAEWRGLLPLAWADFERFLVGWSPGHRMRGGYASRQTRIALSGLTAR
ncbi:MAG: hypothetical protein ACI8RZ_005614 [Myxococcota bacterium]|jgi:hypothetical protein